MANSIPKISKLIKVKVHAESKEEKISKLTNDSYEVFVKEKAERGRANFKVKDMLAKYFEMEGSGIRLLKGGKKPNKIFEITG